MVSSNAAQTTPVIPSDAPHSKFLRYVRAVAKEHPQLFPITPATRPLVVSLDLRTLGPQPADYEDLLHVLRRDEVTPMLVLFGDDPGLAETWMQACEVEERFVIDYTDRASAGRFMDAMNAGRGATGLAELPHLRRVFGDRRAQRADDRSDRG